MGERIGDRVLVLGGSVAGHWPHGLSPGMTPGPSSWTATGSPAYGDRGAELCTAVARTVC